MCQAYEGVILILLKDISHLFYQIKILDQKINKLFEEQVGFSLTRYEMLMILHDKAPCLQGELQNHLQIDQAAITRQLQILEEKGYVARKRNPENNREVIVEPTSKVVAAIGECEANCSRQSLMDIINLSSEEVAQLTRLLEKFDQGLNHIK